MTLRRIGRWAVLGLLAITLFYAVVWSGLIVLTERGLAELSVWTVVIDVVALLGVAAAIICLDRTFSAQGWRLKLLWLGRTFGLIGATIAVSFPATLFNEVVFAIGRGRSPGIWFPTAIDHEAAVIPLVAVPAIVALRWPRLGAAMWVLSGLSGAYERVYQPFGVIFPARLDGASAPTRRVSEYGAAGAS